MAIDRDPKSCSNFKSLAEAMIKETGNYDAVINCKEHEEHFYSHHDCNSCDNFHTLVEKDQRSKNYTVAEFADSRGIVTIDFENNKQTITPWKTFLAPIIDEILNERK